MKNTTDNSKMWAHYKLYLEEMANNTYQDPVISDLYKRRDEFDCIIMQQSYNEVSFIYNIWSFEMAEKINDGTVGYPTTSTVHEHICILLHKFRKFF